MPILVYVFYFLYVIYTVFYFKNRKNGVAAEFWLTKVKESDSDFFKSLADLSVGVLFILTTLGLIYRTIFPLS